MRRRYTSSAVTNIPIIANTIATLAAVPSSKPIHVAIPDGYASAALIEATGHSPWSCSGKACSGARRTDDDGRQSMEFGAGPAVIRVSTENGPVSIATGEESEED